MFQSTASVRKNFLVFKQNYTKKSLVKDLVLFWWWNFYLVFFLAIDKRSFASLKSSQSTKQQMESSKCHASVSKSVEYAFIFVISVWCFRTNLNEKNKTAFWFIRTKNKQFLTSMKLPKGSMMISESLHIYMQAILFLWTNELFLFEFWN